MCDPDLEDVPDYFGINTVPYDRIRKHTLFENADLQKLKKQSKEGKKWKDLGEERIQAITSRDMGEVPEGNRRRVPETITFNLRWIGFQKENGFMLWDQGRFDEVTAPGALGIFKEKSKGSSMDLRPVDSLFDVSLTRNIFHEVCMPLPTPLLSPTFLFFL